MIKGLLEFLPKKRKVRGEVIAKGEGQLASAESSLRIFQERLGWSPQSARYLATAFAFSATDNSAAVLAEAQRISQSESFEDALIGRLEEDPSVVGASLQASRFVSSDELRELLGRILASDVDSPNSVSRRAVSVSEDLSPDDFRAFLKLRPMIWSLRFLQATGYLLVIGKRSSLLRSDFISFGPSELGINFLGFGDLQQLGLLQERVEGILVNWENLGTEEILLVNAGRTVRVKRIDNDSSMLLGMYTLTKAGREIIDLYMNDEFPSLQGYFEEVCAFWQRAGLQVEEVG